MLKKESTAVARLIFQYAVAFVITIILTVLLYNYFIGFSRLTKRYTACWVYSIRCFSGSFQ